MALGPAAIEAFDVSPSRAAESAVVLMVDAPALQPIADAPTGPSLGADPVLAADQLVQGAQILQQVAVLPSTQLSAWFGANPSAVARVLGNPPAASDVSTWWRALGADQRVQLRDAAPSLVGNLEGVPYAVRNVANRELLGKTIAELQRTVASDVGRFVIDEANQQLTMLRAIDAALQSTAGAPARSLVTLDVTGQGRAAVVIGDLRTADYVSFLVPGMFFTIENQMVDWTDAAGRLQAQQLDWLARFAARRGVEQSETVATVAWIGYPTPNLTNVGGIDNAIEGSASLTAALEGLTAMRGGDQPYVSVLAHSYGSTAALMALTGSELQVDALALVGSPGSAAKSVDELSVRGGNVYVGEAPWDPVPNSSYFGSDPGSPSYGAKRIGIDGGVDAVTGETLLPSAGHNEYFSPGTESMRNLALIGIGKGQFVSGAEGYEPTRGTSR